MFLVKLIKQNAIQLDVGIIGYKVIRVIRVVGN
jgi:hypothetical protein